MRMPEEEEEQEEVDTGIVSLRMRIESQAEDRDAKPELGFVLYVLYQGAGVEKLEYRIKDKERK